MHAHDVVEINSKLSLVPELRGKSCYDILHSSACKVLWSNGIKTCSTVLTSYGIYVYFLSEYGLQEKHRTYKSD